MCDATPLANAAARADARPAPNIVGLVRGAEARGDLLRQSRRLLDAAAERRNQASRVRPGAHV
jgi:hypothetical protein